MMHTSNRNRLRNAPARRGISSMWTILWLPVFLLVFTVLINIGSLWLARVELENALEAAALAAVKEWGDADGGSTTIPRNVGVDAAAFNFVRGVPVEIGTNQGVTDVNENHQYTITTGNPDAMIPPGGNLIFGAIDPTDPMFPVTFDAELEPNCGPATVLIDATGQGNLGADNAWGIAFHPTPDTPAGLRITQVVITLQGGGMFDFTGGGPTLSDNVAPHKVVDNSSNSQPDIAGFTDAAAQILFSPTVGMSPTLTIDFIADRGVGAASAPWWRMFLPEAAATTATASAAMAPRSQSPSATAARKPSPSSTTRKPRTIASTRR